MNNSLLIAAKVHFQMDIDGDVEDVSRRVQVRFVTKLKPSFKAPTTTIALPSTLTREGLSSVVNNLLQSGPTSRFWRSF